MSCAGGRANEGKLGQINADGAGGRSLANDDIQGEILHGGLEITETLCEKKTQAATEQQDETHSSSNPYKNDEKYLFCRPYTHFTLENHVFSRVFYVFLTMNFSFSRWNFCFNTKFELIFDAF